MFITNDELLGILEDSNLILIDARSYKDYSVNHIPGAVNLDLFSYHWFDTSKEGLEAFEMQMQKLLSYIGISSEKKVVFYDEISGMSAARGVWLLLCFSFPQVYLLNGGMKNWKDKNFPVETKTNGFKPSKFSRKINNDIIVGYEFIKNNLDKIKLIDTRSKDEFEGKVIRAARGGHIPNAINIDWVQNIKEDGTMKDNNSLFELYQQFSENDVIVTYCQGAYRAANSFLALKKLGFKNVKVYLGSWGEWGNKLELPVA